MERCGCGHGRGRRHWEEEEDPHSSMFLWLPVVCDVVEDYCVSCFCAPCSVSQMSRHTAPYETYEGSCFSSNGMPPHAPVMF
jgi:hypothetical protein